MRGEKRMDTPLLHLNPIYYNFIRPYQALKGKSPAVVAGIRVKGENEWAELIKRSVDNRR